MAAEKNRRKEYFIKKEFQTKFIIRFCALVILGAAISGGALYLLSRSTVTTAFVDSRLSIVTTAHYILPALIGSSLVSVVLIGIATALVIKYLSHRIAGPLFNIERNIKKIGAGDLTVKTGLRTTDEIQEMARCLNDMAENIRKNLSEIKSQSFDLSKHIDALASVDKSLPQEARGALKQLRLKKKELDKAVDYFKL